MKGIFPISWQIIRHELHTTSHGLPAFSPCRSRLLTSQHAKQGSYFPNSMSSIPKYLRLFTPPRLKQMSTPRLKSFPCGQQSRCVSLWRQEPGRSLEKGASDKTAEMSMTEAEIKAIFGQQINPQKGINLLAALQRCRREGTLDQKLEYPANLISKALGYLRRKYPIDEDAAIEARIDREMNGQGLPQIHTEQSSSAISHFEMLKQENKLRAARMQANEKVEEKQDNSKTNLKAEVAQSYPKNIHEPPSEDVLVRLQREPTWVKRYREAATGEDFEKATGIGTMQRLLPSAVITIVVIALSLIFAQHYIPPPRKARFWPDIPPAAATLLAIVGVNVVVFLLWRTPPMWKLMNKSFVVVPVYPYASSMLGASISHQEFAHLFVNVLFLWLIGTNLHDDIGRGPFLALYFSSAVVSAYLPMVIYVMKRSFSTSTLGASGVVTSLIATYLILHEGQSVTFPYLPPEWTQGIDTGMMLAIFILLEAFRLKKIGLPSRRSVHSARSAVDHLGHLAGYATGIGAGAIIRSTDPRWKNVERHHVYTDYFKKLEAQSSRN